MSFTQNFSASQLLGQSNIVVITDTSTGSDVAITQRRVYLTDYAQNYIVPSGTTTDYIQWALSDSSININALTKDVALYVKVQWLDVNNVVLYEKETLVGFKGYNEEFAYELSGYLSNNYKRTADNGFIANLFELRTFIDSGDQAIQLGGDIQKAQVMYDSATEIRTNATYLFNTIG